MRWWILNRVARKVFREGGDEREAKAEKMLDGRGGWRGEARRHFGVRLRKAMVINAFQLFTNLGVGRWFPAEEIATCRLPEVGKAMTTNFCHDGHL
jgi:hypothetical protein